jgi:hypothetical protein
MGYGMKKGRERVSGVISTSSSVRMDWDKRWGSFEVQWLKNLSWKGECTQKKKKIKGFPMFLHWKILKTALFCDIKQWSIRHCRRRRRYRRRHRRSGSRDERKMKNV